MPQRDHAQNVMQSRDDEWFLDPEVASFEVDFAMPEIEHMELALFGDGENGSMLQEAAVLEMSKDGSQTGDCVTSNIWQADSTPRPDEQMDDTHGAADQAELSNTNLRDNVLGEEERNRIVRHHLINPCVVEIDKDISGIPSRTQPIAEQHDYDGFSREYLPDSVWLSKAREHYKTNQEKSFNFLKSKIPDEKPINLCTLLEVGKKLEEVLREKQALGADVSVNHRDPFRPLSWSGNKDTGYIFLPNKHLGDSMKKFITRDIEGIPEYDGVEDPEAYGKKCMSHVSNIMDKRFKVVEPHLTKYQRKYTLKSMATKRSDTRKNRTIEAKLLRSTERNAMTENNSQ